MGSYFLANVLVVIATLILRRKFAGGELGGSPKVKIATSVFFVSLWIAFVLVNSLQSYEYFTL